MPHVAIKAMNDAIGEDGLVPSGPVFRIIPRFPILSTDFSKEKKSAEEIKLARAEINSIIAE